MIPFDPQPVLSSELVHLRPLREADWDDLYAVARDPQIWEQHPMHDRHEEPVFRGFFREAMDSGGALLIHDATDGAVIGSSRYHGYDPGRNEVEIGWTFLARAYWGGRYNGEVKRLMLDHAFRSVGSVIFLVGPENHRSRRAVEKIGGMLDSTRLNGRGEESLVYRLSRRSSVP